MFGLAELSRAIASMPACQLASLAGRSASPAHPRTRPCDNAGGASAGTAHLLARGHRRIGFLGDLETISTARERLCAYREALAGNTVAFDPELVQMNVHGLGRHREVALVGFDDLTLANAIGPGLTVVAQDADRLDRATAERLFARIDGDRGAAQRVIVTTTLIERGSGELRP